MMLKKILTFNSHVTSARTCTVFMAVFTVGGIVKVTEDFSTSSGLSAGVSVEVEEWQASQLTTQ